MDRVHYEGFLSGAEKYNRLSQADIFVSLTTAPFETFHKVNLEALSCGVPVITTDWAANREIVHNGINGFLIDVVEDARGNPCVDREHFIATVETVLRDPSSRATFRQKAVESVRSYDYHQVIPRLVQLLEKRRVSHRLPKGWEKICTKAPIDFPNLYQAPLLGYL